MRRLPLYRTLPNLPAAEEHPLTRDRGCRLCPLHEGVRTVCMAAELSARADEQASGCVLVVGDHPGPEEDSSGRPHFGESGRYLRKTIQGHWKGPTVYTNAVLCAGKGRSTEAAVEACRPYLANTLRESRPRRILACGAQAIEGLTGRRFSPLSIRKGHSFLLLDSTPIPIFYLPSPEEALHNRFVRAAFAEDLREAMTVETVPPPAWTGEARIVETAEDALLAERDIRAHYGMTYDGESAGLQFNRNFRVLSFACTPMRESYAWVWPRVALDRADVREPLRRLMYDKDIAKGGQYIQVDLRMALLEFGQGLPEGDLFDALLVGKLLNPDAKAPLDIAVERVGLGGHKEDMEEAKRRGLIRFRDWWKRHRECDASGQRKQGQLLLVKAKPPSSAEFPLASETLLLELGRLLDLLDSDEHGYDKGDVAPYQYMLVDDPDLLYVYNARDAVATDALIRRNFALLERVPELVATWFENVAPMIRDVARMEAWGIPASLAAMEAKQTYWEGRASALRERFRPYGWDPDKKKSTFNPDSAKQLAELLYDKLKLTPPYMTDAEDSEMGSTGEDALLRIKDAHPVVADILAYKKYATRIKRDWRRFVRDDGRIHANFHMDGARTGRFSVSDPSLQNMEKPSKGDPESHMERNCFVSDAQGALQNEEWVFVECDFGQIQPRLAAGLSGDPAFIQAVSAGDFHTNAARILAKVLWGDANAEITPDRRQQVKPIDLAALFDDDPYGLALRQGIEKDVAESIFDALFGAFRRFKGWYQEQIHAAQEQGGVWTWWNGRNCRWIPLWNIALPPCVGRDGKSRPDPRFKTARRASWNGPIQGSEIDFTLAAVHDVLRWIREDRIPAEVNLIVHDSILLRVRKELAAEVLAYTKDAMTSLPMPNGVPLVADAKQGKTYGELQDVKE